MMKMLCYLYEKATDELDDVFEYSELAAEYKMLDSDLSKLFHDLAEQEYNHSSRLYNTLTNKSVEMSQRFSDSDMHSCMNTLWHEKNKKIVDKMSQAKACLDSYR